MNYGELETAIVNRLAPLVTAGHEVVSQPENQNDFKRTINGARVTVGYIGSDFAKVSSTAQIRQEETLKFEVAIQVKKLRGNGGLYSIIEAVRALLIGFRPPHCERMRIMEIGVVDYVDNVFTYAITFGATSLAVEQFTEEDAVLITKITIDSNPDNPGAVVVPPPNTFPPNPPSARVGDISYWNGEVWVRLAPGNSGEVLHTAGIGNAPYWDVDDAGATETDPVFTQWLNGNPFDGYATQTYVGTELVNYYTKTQSDARYLQSFTETDPTVASHVKNITSQQISNWNTAFDWGNHASAGYLTSFTETDPTVGSHIKAITTTNISNWNSAFGWGNHASAGYALASALSSYVPTSRTLTINGQSFNLTADRSWTVTAGAGGSTGQVQYNNAGSLAGTGAFLFNGTQVGIGVGQVAATRLTVAGINADTSANFVARFTNIAGTANYLTVRGDGFIGFGDVPFSALQYRFRVGTNLNVYFGVMGGQTSMGSVDDATNNIQFTVNGNPLVWQVGTTEFVRLTSSQFRVQNTVFDVNQFIGTGQAVSLLNLNNTNNQVATSILNYTISGSNLVQLRAEATAGDDNFQIRVTNSGGTLVEAARFQGSGNTLFGTTTDIPSALVTMRSTTKGLLIPEMTSSQRAAISSPANGLLVMQTDGGAGVEGLYRYQLSTTSWVRIG